MFAAVHNVSRCWVCAELPVKAAEGLPWHITPATAENWMWIRTWNTTLEWDQLLQAMEALLHHDHCNSLPLMGYVISNGWGWLAGKHVKLWARAPHCIEQVRFVPNHITGCLSYELCINTTFANISKVWWHG